MLIANKTRTVHLRKALTGVGLQLKYSECIEVLSKLGPETENTVKKSDASSNSTDELQRAEQFVGELFEGLFKPDYKIYLPLFEEKFHIFIPEIEFQKNAREEKNWLVPTLVESLWAAWRVRSAQATIGTRI